MRIIFNLKAIFNISRSPMRNFQDAISQWWKTERNMMTLAQTKWQICDFLVSIPKQCRPKAWRKKWRTVFANNSKHTVGISSILLLSTFNGRLRYYWLKKNITNRPAIFCSFDVFGKISPMNSFWQPKILDLVDHNLLQFPLKKPIQRTNRSSKLKNNWKSYCEGHKSGTGRNKIYRAFQKFYVKPNRLALHSFKIAIKEKLYEGHFRAQSLIRRFPSSGYLFLRHYAQIIENVWISVYLPYLIRRRWYTKQATD